VLPCGTLSAAEPPRPNIVVFFADNLGWGHVGWQNPNRGKKVSHPTPAQLNEIIKQNE